MQIKRIEARAFWKHPFTILTGKTDYAPAKQMHLFTHFGKLFERSRLSDIGLDMRKEFGLPGAVCAYDAGLEATVVHRSYLSLAWIQRFRFAEDYLESWHCSVLRPGDHYS